MKEKILLIDTLGQLFRSYYALEKTNLQNSKGVKTFGIYGFFKSLFKAIKQLNPDSIIIAMEGRGKSIRKAKYPEYKANRKEAPEDLKEQITLLINFLEENDFPILYKDGLEADDVIATLSQYFDKKGSEVFILSSDKDLYQLVNERVFILKHPQKVSSPFSVVDEAGVYEKFGVKPSQIKDYLAIVGDSSDNIPGVSGLGPKGAQKLLESYETLQGIYENLENIQGNTKEKLSQSKEKAFLSLSLAELIYDDSLLKSLPFHFTSDHMSRLKKVFQELEFKNIDEVSILETLIKRDFSTPEEEETFLFENLPPELENFKKESVKYSLIKTRADLTLLLERVKQEKKFVFDVETTSLNVFEMELLGISFAFKAKEAFYISFESRALSEFSLKDFIESFQDVFFDETIFKIGHNLKYDYKILSFYFPDIKGLFCDTMLASYLLNPDLKRYGMDFLAQYHLNYKTMSYSDLVDSKKDENLKNVELEDVKNYACEDADITFQLYEILWNLLEKTGLLEPFRKLEMPLIPILAEMELVGISIDKDHFKKLEFSLGEEIESIKKTLYKKIGEEINLNSPKQIAHILYDKLKLKPPTYKKNKSGFSTDEETLIFLKDQHSLIEDLLNYRQKFKMYSTYVKPLPEYCDKSIDGISIHSSFNQVGTATGRLSSNDPNLQNIPVRDDFGREIRQGFIAREGKALVGLDYSQIELRLMAHFSKDPYLIDAFVKGEDVHRFTAARIFNKNLEDIENKERNIAKTINFGIIYGMGAQKLSRELSLPLNEARRFIEKYFEMFTGVYKFINDTKKQAHENQYVTTILGRKRILEDINGSSSQVIAAQERIAVNSIIQGSNADLMKSCMISWYKNSFHREYSSLLLQIHDELIFEVEKTHLNQISHEIKEIMESITSLEVPLKVSLQISQEWGNLK